MAAVMTRGVVALVANILCRTTVVAVGITVASSCRRSLLINIIRPVVKI